MIQIESTVMVVDNSGVMLIKCLKILNKSNKSVGYIGDLLVCLVSSLKKYTKKKKKRIKEKDIVYGLVVTIKNSIKRNGGNIIINFDKSSVILLNKSMNPLGNRIKNPIFKELSIKGHIRLLTLSKFLI